MRLVFLMSVAGSFIVLIYYLLKPILKLLFTAKWQYRILTLALFFYLVPLQLGKLFYENFIKMIIPNQMGNEMINLSKNVLQITSGGQLYVSFPWNKIIVLLIWSLVALGIIFSGYRIYFRQKKELIINSKKLEEETLLSLLEKKKEQLKIKRKIFYRTSNIIKEPLAIGVFRPTIILPTRHFNEEEITFICEHELLHIKNSDTLFKFLGMYVIALNWYNPFAYLMFREMNFLSENVCDEAIVLLATKDQRMKYGNLIIKMVTEKKQKSLIFASAFTNNKGRVEERVKRMLSVKKKRKIIGILAVCLLIGLGLGSSLTVFAYTPITTVMVEEESEFIKNKEAETTFMTNNFTEQGNKLIPLQLQEGNYFQDLDGNIYIIDNQKTSRGCTHNYVSGSINEHVKNGTGCITNVYDAKRCSKCGLIVKGSLNHKTEYTNCPH